MIPRRYLLIGALLSVLPALFPLILELAGWYRPDLSLATLGTVLATYAGWIGIVYSVSKILEISNKWQPARDLDPLRPVTLADLLARIGRGAKVAYVERDATSADLLRHHRYIAITGHMKLGKTREAIQLIRRAVADDLVTKTALFEPTPALAVVSAGALPAALDRLVDPRAATLLLLDPPFHVTGPALDRLSDLIAAMRRCKTCTVLATARTDQLDASPEHRNWPEHHGFHPVPLPDPDAAQAGQLLTNAASTFDVRVPAAARAALIAAATVPRNRSSPACAASTCLSCAS